MAMSSQPQSSQSGHLTSDDLQEVFEALYSITSNYVSFGMKLNVPLSTIRATEKQYANPCDCLIEILDYRLKQLPPLTWHDIVQALQSPTVQQHDLARTIESQYITASQSPASVSQQASAESSHAAIHIDPIAESHPINSHSDIPQPKRPRYDIPESQCIENAPPIVPHLYYKYIEQYIEYVRDIYKRSVVGNPKDTKWPPFASKCFINLAIIDQNTVSLAKAHEYTKAMVKNGDVDVILKEKRSMDFMDIAKDIPNNRIILVEGAPGVGKSTFAWEFCRRWERGEIAQQYQLVLLLRLRDEKMSTAKTLEDFISYPASVSVCQAVVQKFKSTLGKDVLMILEGFDELPNLCREESSIFMQLINGNILPNATILITSRPWATADIHRNNYDRIFQHIEILGFTGPQIEEYIESVFNHRLDEATTQNKSEIMTYIKQYPQIMACMYIPLNSVIVVSVYQESKAGRCILPRTLTELYYALTQTLLVRYLKGHPEYARKKLIIKSLDRDLPAEVHKHLLDVSAIAYKGICSDKMRNVELIFRDLPSDLQTLGLMQSVPQLYVTEGAVVSHNFLHLTVQEFLAALHTSLMSPEQQLEHFQRHEDGRLRVVLRFLAGLTKLTALTHDQFKGLLREIPDQQGDEQQRDCCKRMVPDISVSAHHINWLFEAQNTVILQSLLYNHTVSFEFTREMQPLEYYSLGYCIVHSNCNWSLDIRRDTEEEKLQMRSSGAESGDAKSTEYRVALRTEPMSSEYLNIMFTGLGPHLAEMYLKLADNGSSLSLTNLPALHNLELGMCSESTLNLSSDFPLQSLESLTINTGNAGNTLGLKSCEAICKLLSTSTSLKELHFNVSPRKTWSMSTKGMEAITKSMSDNMALLPLRSLQIECKCTFSNTAVTSLALFIKNSTSLKYVSMCNIAVSAQGLQEVHEAIQHCSSLHEKKLKLLLHVGCSEDATKYEQLFNDYPDTLDSIDWKATSRISKSDKQSDVLRLSAITICLYYNRSSSDLDLSSWNISDAGATSLAQALHHNSTLKELNLHSNNISDAGATSLAQALHHNSTLKVLDLCYNNISDAGATDLAQALHHNSTLKELNLFSNNISDAGATALAQTLHHNSTLKELNLSRNNISDVGATALAQALHHNSTLKELNLFSNNISDAGATDLAQALRHNSTLERLNLYNNNISDVGATDLAQALRHNSTLEWLYLDGNDGIGEEGTRQLVQALTVNTSINRLFLPKRCKEYASQCMEYNAVKTRISFR